MLFEYCLDMVNDNIVIATVADDKKLLGGGSFAHDAFETLCRRVGYTEALYGALFLLSIYSSGDDSMNCWMFFNFLEHFMEFFEYVVLGFYFCKCRFHMYIGR